MTPTPFLSFESQRPSSLRWRNIVQDLLSTLVPLLLIRKDEFTLVSFVDADSGYRPTPWNGIYCASKSALHSITDVLSMECIPLNIRVLLVSPGAIKSNISKNESTIFNLPPDSLYGAFIHNIIARMNASQGLHVAMPNELFAKKVVQKALLPNPPYYMTLGGYSLKFWLLTWLPRSWVLWIMWKQHTQKA